MKAPSWSTLFVAFLLSALPAPAQTNVPLEAVPGAATNAATMKALLDNARVKATNLLEWAKKDFDRVGTWRYRVVTIKTSEASDAQVEVRLNELGKEGWDCFWCREKGDSLTFYFKKAEKSMITETLKYRP